MPTHKNMFELADTRYALWQELAEILAISATKITSTSTKKITSILNQLSELEQYWAFPGMVVMQEIRQLHSTQRWVSLAQWVTSIESNLATQNYRTQGYQPFSQHLVTNLGPQPPSDIHTPNTAASRKQTPYFELLILRDADEQVNLDYINNLLACTTADDGLVYQVLVVNSVADALIAILANPTIAVCIMHPKFKLHTSAKIKITATYQTYTRNLLSSAHKDIDQRLLAASEIHSLRSSCDCLLISEQQTDFSHSELLNKFKRIVHTDESFQNLHYQILAAVRDRQDTPFFNALQLYTNSPKTVFHALPISRGASLHNSHWLADIQDFYGQGVFLAETSSTHGGLDSLLDPKGPIKQAQDKAAHTFGSQQSYFVTNGTSTSNKIVLQATVKPQDIVLVASDCHKSVPYSLTLSGSYPIFLPTYELDKYAIYGGVSLHTIKAKLLELKAAGQLEQVAMIILTNATFDGIVYNVRRYMQEILAIAPHIIFHWDEAWFAFAHFHPLYNNFSAMSAIKQLEQDLATDTYKKFYDTWQKKFTQQAAQDPNAWLEQRLYPDPDKCKFRVYVTQSTHKTLTSFRQGSMIHIHDSAFNEELFLEAFYTHTSTSPNYQIIASLDVGRRQVALEGYELVQRTIKLAMHLRHTLQSNTLLGSYFTVLTDCELVANTSIRHLSSNYLTMLESYPHNEFIVDPTKITLDISNTGMDGTSLQQLLINRYEIQINKTSTNSVLFIVNIGATQESIDYLLEVLTDIASELEQSQQQLSKPAQDQFSQRIAALSQRNISLLQDKRFHRAFIPEQLRGLGALDMRGAYFAAYIPANISYCALDKKLLTSIETDDPLVSAAYVTPYPPGFPILVPGQIITSAIIKYLMGLKITEIHGLKANLGLKVFTQQALIQ
jgi:arginine decarboxylase